MRAGVVTTPTVFIGSAMHAGQLSAAMLDELARWAQALRPLRAS